MSDERPPITELSRQQRRVLGVLLEKGFTTPEYYPLTLKAVTAGCCQKSNRSPVVEFSQDDAADALEELRELGLVGVLHTESGRTERYRHYMRKRFDLTEPQLAVLTELLLRGRQQLGELRSRASRMVPVPGQQELREALAGLDALGLLQASGPLERRGVEVDHNLYRASERQTLTAAAPAEPRDVDEHTPASPADGTELAARIQSLEESVRLMSVEIREIRDGLRQHSSD